jgi:hypothetical protein
MSAAWDRAHNRYEVAARVLDDVRRSRHAETLTRWSDEIEAAFGDLDAFLRHVQRRWYTALAARVDRILEDEVWDRQAAVREAWEELARLDPASRLVLDAYSGHPALEHGERRHSQLLGAALMPPQDVTTSAPTPARSWWPRWCPLRSLLRLLPG